MSRYYFIATAARTLFGEPVDAGSELVYVTNEGFGGRKHLPFAELKRFKPHSFSAPKGGHNIMGCTWAYIDVGTSVNLDTTFCLDNSPWTVVVKFFRTGR